MPQPGVPQPPKQAQVPAAAAPGVRHLGDALAPASPAWYPPPRFHQDVCLARWTSMPPCGYATHATVTTRLGCKVELGMISSGCSYV